MTASAHRRSLSPFISLPVTGRSFIVRARLAGWIGRMRLAVALLAAAVSVAAPCLGERLPGGSNFEVFAFDNEARMIDDIELVQYPSDEVVKSLIPASAASSLRIEWECSVTEQGKLTRCKLERAWPEQMNMRPIASALLPQLSIRSDDAVRVLAAHGSVYVSAYLDDNTRKLNRDCPPGWCPVTPAPPAQPSPG